MEFRKYVKLSEIVTFVGGALVAFSFPLAFVIGMRELSMGQARYIEAQYRIHCIERDRASRLAREELERDRRHADIGPPPVEEGE